MTSMDRRAFVAGALLASGLPWRAGGEKAEAGAPQAGKAGPAFYRFRLGDYELTALYDGIWHRPIDGRFVRNAPFAEVQKALAENFLSVDRLSLPITALVVNTGVRLILIDTGSAGQLAATAGSMMSNLVAAGINPKAIDTILVSHFHPDHINGIKTKDGRMVFPDAEIKVPAPEWTYWMDEVTPTTVPEAARGVLLNAGRIFADLRKEVTQFAPGSEVAPGITSIAAYGHTPGHVAYAVASGDSSMMVLCDTTNHPWLFVRHPDWQPIFDMDGPLAAAFRRRMLDRVAADRMLVQGYHFPFPAIGHIAKSASGYEFVPVQWQPAL